MIKQLFKNQQEIENLPEEIQEFLDNPKTIEELNKIIEEFGLKEEQEKKLALIVFKIAKGEINLYDAPSEIEEKLDIELNKALDIDGEMFGRLFSDIEEILNAQRAAHQASRPKQRPIIEEEEKKELEKNQKKVKQDFVPLIEKAIKKFELFSTSHPANSGATSLRHPARNGAKRSGDAGSRPPSQDILQERFEDISESFLGSVRTKAQFKDALIKPKDKGGMGFGKNRAEEIASFYSSYLRIKELEKKKEKEEEIGEKAKIKDITKIEPVVAEEELEKPKSTKAIPLKSFMPLRENSEQGEELTKQPRELKEEVGFESEEKEVETHKKKVEELKGAAPKLTPAKEQAERALKEVNISFPSAEMQERFKKIIEARLREARTADQTFRQLIVDTNKGGLGFSKEEADKISLILNKYMEDDSGDIYKSKLEEAKRGGKKVSLEEEGFFQEDSIKEQSREEMLKKLTEGTKLKNKKIAKSLGISTPMAPRPELKKQKELLNKKDAPSKLRASSEKKSELPKEPIVSQTPPSQKPQVEDIKYIPKLYGPIQEIGEMKIEDFRKLSSDPKEAIEKIKDKLALLREESYKKYQEGVFAWLASPIYKEYLKLLEESLKGEKSLEEILNFSKTLNKNEFNAIIESKIT